MKTSEILTLIFSSGALFFSFVNYRRGKRFENENFIYKSKVETYIKILSELERLINLLDENIEEAEEYSKDLNKENFKILNDIADKVDQACLDFNTYIIGCSLIIPEKIVRLLSVFCNKIIYGDTLDSESETIEKGIEDAEEVLDELIILANNISVELRKDLRADELNSSLYQRIK